MIDDALAWHSLGYAPLPLKIDGSKGPWVDDWKTFQNDPPTRDEVVAIFGRRATTDGIGIICGTASGNLEMFELEGRAVAEGLLDDLAGAMNDNGFGDLWQRIDNGYVEQTPSGGIHWHYRVDGPAMPNTKLARRPAGEEELLANPDEKIKVLIETRGEGGFTVVAPSGGRTHATGRDWTTLRGERATIPTISLDERDALFAISSIFDQMPAVEPPAEKRGTIDLYGGLRPGDDFNTRGNWNDILTGWTRAHHFGRNHYGWRRPGKDAGISATTGANDGDNLFVFSTSTEFEDLRPYSKFAAFATLHHGGDFAAAASALRSQGYGKEPQRPVNTPQPTSDGALATVTQLKPKQASSLLHTDDANALALVSAYGEKFRHCAERGRWYAWNGHTWAECAKRGGLIREYAKDVARALPEDEPKDVTHKRRSLSANGITAMLTQAETDDRVAVEYNDLDAHPWELNTPGGIVDLRTGTLAPADPAKLHTRSALCTPDKNADRTAWLQFLDTTFGGDAALIEYMQRLVGYSAIGLVGAHILPYCHGGGGNGKGVFLEACVKVLDGYATTAPAGFLMAKTYASHETEIARLAGCRMVLCSEVNDEDRFDEARVKQLTGGDTLTARFMNQDHFTFTPTHTLWAMGNHKPHVRAGGRSFWRRLRLIPFLHEVPADEIIDDLQGILAAEHGPAILSWIIEGAVAYAREGLVEPDAVKAATDTYQSEQDTVGRFLEDECIVVGGEHVQIKVGIVRARYEAWCREGGDEAVSAKAFGIALRRFGIESKRTNSTRMYVGLAMKNASPENEDASQPEAWWDR